MTLLRIAVFKREPSVSPSDNPIIILHLHDKEVSLCTHLYMYVWMDVWVLKRTLATVRHESSSFISAQKMEKGLFNVEPGSLCLCSSCECSSLATVNPELWCGILALSAGSLWHLISMFVCLHVCMLTLKYSMITGPSITHLYTEVCCT